jgi:hypothetical protein
MSSSALDANRVIRLAARALKHRPGQHIERLTEDITSELSVTDVSTVRQTLVDNWDRINTDAGFGRLLRATLIGQDCRRLVES